MRNPYGIFSAGKYRVVDIPSIGSYDLVSGQGYSGGEYEKSPCAFACMDVRSVMLSQIPFRIVTKTDEGGAGEERVIEDSPLAEYLNAWGTFSSWADAIRATEIDMLMTGSAFWLKERAGLSRLNPTTIEVVTTERGVSGFKQRVLSAGKTYQREFTRDQVVYFREYHPVDDLGKGIPKITVAKNAILAEYEAQRYISAYFKNDAIPGLLIRTEQDVPPQEMTKLAAWWDEKFGRAKNHHKVAFVDKGLEAQILSTDLRAMALSEVRDEARRDICSIFGVDPILIGAMGKGSFSNTHEARLSMMQEVILPRADYYADVINAELVGPYDPAVKFEFATDEMPILQEDKDKLATRLALMLDKKVITVEYYREKMGIPADAGPSTEELAAQAQKQLEIQAQKPADMAKWEKKAMKALRAGKSANVAFESEEIPEGIQNAIRARLGKAQTVVDVEAAFHVYP